MVNLIQMITYNDLFFTFYSFLEFCQEIKYKGGGNYIIILTKMLISDGQLIEKGILVKTKEMTVKFNFFGYSTNVGLDQPLFENSFIKIFLMFWRNFSIKQQSLASNIMIYINRIHRKKNHLG